MGDFKKSVTLSGKFKDIAVNEKYFYDPETGEEINVIEILHRIYGDNIFSISTSYKEDNDIE